MHVSSQPFMVRPPETLRTCPVMKPASSLAKNRIAPGRSSGWPMRPSGIARGTPHQLLGVAGAFLVVGEQRRVGRPRADHVDGDAVARMLAGDGLGEATSPPLHAAYTASPDEPTRAASDAMLTMRPCARRHAGQHRVVHVQRAGQVDGDQLVPLGRLGLGERLEHVPAGVVDQHVDRPERRLGRGDRASTLARSVMSQPKAWAAPPLVADAGGDLLGRASIQVEHGDACAFAGEAPAGRAADPPPPPVTITVFDASPRTHSSRCPEI